MSNFQLSRNHVLIGKMLFDPEAFTTEKLPEWDVEFVPIRDICNLKDMKRIWVIQTFSKETGTIKIRVTFDFPKRILDLMDVSPSSQEPLAIPTYEVWGVIINYDGTREPIQKKYDPRVIWKYVKRWAPMNISPGLIPGSIARFHMRQEGGLYVLSPPGSIINLHQSDTGLAWASDNGAFWDAFPDELEIHANDLIDVTIPCIDGVMSIEFGSFDEFIREIGLGGPGMDHLDGRIYLN